MKITLFWDVALCIATVSTNGGKRNAYRILVGKPGGKRSLG
jgi:hypothetical protein